MPTMTKKHRIRLVDPQGGHSPIAGSASRQDKGRWSSRRKTEVVLSRGRRDGVGVLAADEIGPIRVTGQCSARDESRSGR
jgi:hypothetical protein